jgi:hypothetical protein
MVLKIEVSGGRGNTSTLAQVNRWKGENFGQNIWDKIVVVFVNILGEDIANNIKPNKPPHAPPPSPSKEKTLGLLGRI